MKMKKVIGIGGIFFKAEDPAKLKAWYEDNLGIHEIFRWQDAESRSPRFTAWNVFHETSPVFVMTKKPYVINYCVENLDELLGDLKKEGVRVSEKTETDDSGKFGYAIDPDGNKVILWEPSRKDSEIPQTNSDRVTGLGGVFFKSDDPKKLNDWYSQHIGLVITEWGSSFQWIDPNDKNAKVPASTAWSIFSSDTDYFNPSQKPFMFNYRVKNLPGLLKALEAGGTEIAGELQEFSYGKFGWVVDPEGNKIELWEPKDDGF